MIQLTVTMWDGEQFLHEASRETLVQAIWSHFLFREGAVQLALKSFGANVDLLEAGSWSCPASKVASATGSFGVDSGKVKVSSDVSGV